MVEEGEEEEEEEEEGSGEVCRLEGKHLVELSGVREEEEGPWKEGSRLRLALQFWQGLVSYCLQ